MMRCSTLRTRPRRIRCTLVLQVTSLYSAVWSNISFAMLRLGNALTSTASTPHNKR